jgi:hypothetical protein
MRMLHKEASPQSQKLDHSVDDQVPREYMLKKSLINHNITAFGILSALYIYIFYQRNNYSFCITKSLVDVCF